jgi:hypothetical protein
MKTINLYLNRNRVIALPCTNTSLLTFSIGIFVVIGIDIESYNRESIINRETRFGLNLTTLDLCMC